MTTNPTPQTDAERLAEIIAREQKATEGPWICTAGKFADDDDLQPDAIYYGVQGNNLSLSFGNADFIAHARADIPWLLQQLADTQAERDALQKRVEVLEEALRFYASGEHYWVHEPFEANDMEFVHNKTGLTDYSRKDDLSKHYNGFGGSSEDYVYIEIGKVAREALTPPTEGSGDGD